MDYSVESFLAKYPRVRLATPSDNQALLEFFRRVGMDASKFSLRFDRSPNFFRLLDLQSERSYVPIFLNDDGSIGGVASVCFRTNYVDGQPVNTVYLGDLRLSPRLSRETRKQWRGFYSDFLETAHLYSDFNHCRYFYSVVLDDNMPAVSALIRKGGEIIYREIAKYRTITLLARFRPSRSKSQMRIRRATEADLPRLRDFLSREHKHKVFGQHFTAETGVDELDRQLGSWDSFQISSFWLAEDGSGEIAACVCPWEGAGQSRRLIIDRMPLWLKIFGRILPLFGKLPIVAEKELKILYLTHIEFRHELSLKEKNEIFGDFLGKIYQSGITKNFHFVSFFDFPSQSLIDSLRGYFYQLTPATLYQVLHRNHQTDEGLVGLPRERLPGLDIGNA